MTDGIRSQRMLRWTKDGVTNESDQRHVEIVVKDMNMKKANAAHAGGASAVRGANFRLSSPDMTKNEASRFQGLVACVNYLSLDRPDLQRAAKTASQHMAQPKVGDWTKIKQQQPGGTGIKFTHKASRTGSSREGNGTSRVDNKWKAVGEHPEDPQREGGKWKRTDGNMRKIVQEGEEACSGKL